MAECIRISIDVRKNKGFIIHEQPEEWFEREIHGVVKLPDYDTRVPLKKSHLDWNEAYECLPTGTYQVRTVACPELRRLVCYCAFKDSQIGTTSDIHCYDHFATIQAMHDAITALVTLARRDGLEFLLTP